tara:strand:- start:9878 stop:11749 length:1872 start_codon:yes stop_codon:yes gene_type:complete
MSEQLRVELSGDNKDLNRSLKDAESSLKKFETAANKSVSKADQSLNGTAKSMNGLKGATANATPTLQEFSRVIQDAPYGIQGVGNNITQLVSQFGYLSKASGGGAAAFKALAGSLLGPAGILFAVSAVVSLLTVYSDELFNAKNKTKQLEDETKKAAESLDRFVNSLNDVARAQIKGAQASQNELVQLRQLRSVAEDTSRSTIERKKAVQELQKLFPDYLGSLSKEKILNGGLKTTYDELTASIVRRAKATAATNILTENLETQIALEQKLAALNNDILDAEQKSLSFSKQKAQQNKAFASNTQAQRDASLINSATENKLAKDLNNLLEERKNIVGQIQGSELENIDLEKLINENGTVDLSKVKLTGSPKVKLNPNINQDGLTDSLLKNFEGVGELASKRLEDGFNADSPTLRLLDGKALKGDIDMLKNIFAASEFEVINQRIENFKDRGIEALKQFNEAASSIIDDGIANTFANLGATLGESLASGADVLSALGSSLLSSLGGILVELGKMAIATGVGLLAVKLSLETLGGAGAIAAGIALVAIGSAFASNSKNLGSSMGSGGSTGSSVSGGGSSSSSSISTGGGFSEGNVVFEIAGTKLVGVLKRTLDRNRSLGGDLGLTT